MVGDLVGGGVFGWHVDGVVVLGGSSYVVVI